MIAFLIAGRKSDTFSTGLITYMTILSSTLPNEDAAHCNRTVGRHRPASGCTIEAKRLP